LWRLTLSNFYYPARGREKSIMERLERIEKMTNVAMAVRVDGLKE
jgi:hypothetical protein